MPSLRFQISVERAVEIDIRRNVDTSFDPDVYRQPVLTETISEPGLLRSNVDSSFSSSSPVIELGTSGKFV